MITKKQKGQSIIEYIILVTAIIVVMLVFLGRGGVFEQSYENVIDGQGDDILNMSQQIFN